MIQPSFASMKQAPTLCRGNRPDRAAVGLGESAGENRNDGHLHVVAAPSAASAFQIGDDVQCLDPGWPVVSARIMEAEYADANDERSANVSLYTSLIEQQMGRMVGPQTYAGRLQPTSYQHCAEDACLRTSGLETPKKRAAVLSSTPPPPTRP